jgi:phosphoribosylanthranilate isomerase
VPQGARAVPAKICGLTRPEDAEAAVRLGASLLGVVFAGGPRAVEPAAARAIVAAAGEVPVFGVFSSRGAEEILRLRESTGLSGAQLHGGADPALVQRLRAEGMQVLVVARLASAGDLEPLELWRRHGVPVLVEPRVPGRLGGTGVRLRLELAVAARERLAGHPLILAGGLTPESVAEAVRAVHPDGVDVSSGVEQIPGIKDHLKLARFLEALAWV